jgi:hypothetical protein
MRNRPTQISERCEVNRGPLAGLHGIVTSIETSGHFMIHADDPKGVYVLLPATSLSLTPEDPSNSRKVL